MPAFRSAATGGGRRHPARRRGAGRYLVAALACGTADRVAVAQMPRDSVTATPRGTVVVTPGAKYRAGWLHRTVLGEDYRALWTAPIEVELLDLRTVAGGLRPAQKGGSMQTISLRFDGADGREYVFRPSEKDFTRGMPPDLRETLVRDIAQDQVAGYHPAAAVVVSRLLDATGLHHPRPRLVVMPDDKLLGEFRTEFAGVLGTFEERPGRDFDATSESPGATQTSSSDRLFERLQEDPATVVDARGFLAARLFDVLVGDRDRHRDQWRWARFSSAKGAVWEPIPRDRDMPFARFEGLGPTVIRGLFPQMVTFGDDYPDMVWLNWNAREIDRRLLADVERPVWDSVARELQLQVSDAVIDSAIAEMPRSFVEADGQVLRRALVRRREQLPQAARSFYQVLAREVNLHGTDQPDLATITRFRDGSVEVALFAPDSSGGLHAARAEPYRRRRFQPGETREVRVVLHDGDDRVVVGGARRRDIVVRIVGGRGDDVVTDSVPRGDRALSIHDAEGTDAVVSEGAVVIDRKPYRPHTKERPEREPRDWGTWSFVRYGASFAPGVGLVASASYNRFHYGFRRDPWAMRSIGRVDLSVGERRPRFVYEANLPSMNSRNVTSLQLVASGIELIRFHGLGNETPSDRDTEWYRVFQNVFRVEPRRDVSLNHRVTASLSALAQFSATRDDARTLLEQVQPYGVDEFGQLGVGLAVEMDHRDAPTATRRGVHVKASANLFPPLWSVESAFGQASVVASTYLSGTGPRSPVLALRAGGRHLWGKFPFHEASFLGGLNTVRGWDLQRFAGRSSAFGSAELRLFVRKVRIVAPADLGVHGLVDAGRVFADGDRSRRWHTGFGGGLWLAPLMRSNTVSLTVARGRERTGLYLASGFAF